jgi:hypothetical protein
MSLTIRLGHTLDFILLLNGIGVTGPPGRIDEFLGQAFRHGLQVAKGGFAGARREQIEGVVHAAKGRHIDGLSSDHSRATDARRVFPGTGVDNGIHDDLNGILVREQMDDFQGVLNDADGHELFTGVAAFFH